jgi:hypothetical protein
MRFGFRRAVNSDVIGTWLSRFSRRSEGDGGRPCARRDRSLGDTGVLESGGWQDGSFDDIHEISYPKFYQAHLQMSGDCQSRQF